LLIAAKLSTLFSALNYTFFESLISFSNLNPEKKFVTDPSCRLVKRKNAHFNSEK